MMFYKEIADFCGKKTLTLRMIIFINYSFGGSEALKNSDFSTYAHTSL
jgi:hypothetical protein